MLTSVFSTFRTSITDQSQNHTTQLHIQINYSVDTQYAVKNVNTAGHTKTQNTTLGTVPRNRDARLFRRENRKTPPIAFTTDSRIRAISAGTKPPPWTCARPASYVRYPLPKTSVCRRIFNIVFSRPINLPCRLS